MKSSLNSLSPRAGASTAWLLAITLWPTAQTMAATADAVAADRVAAPLASPASAFGTTAIASPSRTATFDIPALPLPAALALFSRQSGAQLVYAPALVDGRNGRAVQGTLSIDAALSDLVRGAGLVAHRRGSTLTLEVAPSQLREVSVSAPAEDAYGPVSGYVARRSATATKTDTPLLETPQSISVVGADEMALRKSDSLSDALGYVPSIVAQPNGFARLTDDYNVRGFDAGARTGSILRDGMKLQAAQFDGGQEPYGLERVELLRGASSVLYGQLSPGGLINTVSKRPTPDPLHEINLQLGSHGRKQLSTDHGGRLNDDGSLTYRLTALVRRSDTQVDPVQDNKLYIAPALTWRPSAATSITLLTSYQKIDTRLVAPMDYNTTIFSSRPGPKIGYRQFTGERDYDNYDGRMTTAGYVAEHRFASGVLLRHALRTYRSDVDYRYLTPRTISGSSLARRYDTRFDDSRGVTSDTNVQWTGRSGLWESTVLGGVDVYRKDYSAHRFTGNAPALPLNGPSMSRLPTVTSVDSGSELISLQKGVYAQGQFKFDDKWVLVAGGRYDWADSKTTVYQTGARTDQDDRKFSGRLGLVRTFDNGVAPYVSFSQSFFPTTSGSARPGTGPFKPTVGEQFEAGVRYQPVGSKTLLSAALYQLTQKNVVTDDPADSRYDVQRGKVRSRGLELEARATLAPGLQVIAAYNYTDARTTADTDPAVVGSATQGVPRHTASVWADYRLGMLGLPAARVAAGVRYLGPLATAASASERRTPGYTLVDATFTYDLDAHWQLGMRAQNLFDKQYLYCSGTCRYGDRLTVMGTASYRW